MIPKPIEIRAITALKIISAAAGIRYRTILVYKLSGIEIAGRVV
jgi:hypothetical protein